ncbi:MAG TPA: hypothetical protein DCM48_03720 [Thalassospira sp.]|nr:hypothetical protein [Thalassospira sp.]
MAAPITMTSNLEPARLEPPLFAGDEHQLLLPCATKTLFTRQRMTVITKPQRSLPRMASPQPDGFCGSGLIDQPIP